MPAETLSKEALRILVADVGYKLASQQTGIAYATLRQWNHRYKWNLPTMATNTRARELTTVTRVTRAPADAHADILAQRKHDSALHLSGYLVDASKELKGKKDSRHFKDLVQGRSGLWPEQQSQANILQLAVLVGNEGFKRVSGKDA